MQAQVKYISKFTYKLKKGFTVVGVFGLLSLSLYHSETFAADLCSEIFADAGVSADAKAGAQFLHERDSQLHTTDPVEKAVGKLKRSTGTTLTKPVDKIVLWLENLNLVAVKAEASSRAAAVVKESFYEKFAMKAEKVPESYYAQQTRIARERGHGDVVFSKEQKIQMAETLISDQKNSLDSWIEYLISKDTNMYPMWLKYWMFSGMTKLSKYDPESGTFGNSSKKTVAPFPELNREALAYVADAVLRKVNKQSLAEITDPEFVKLLEGVNFGKLYGRVLFKLGVGKEGQFKTNEGRWVVYPKGSDHMALVKSLEGRNTGWCTAGEAIAKDQLSKGDFHVFYSLDGNGHATLPRVAIRMEADQIAEVRGVAKDQNLDLQINQSSVVLDKMQDFGTKGKAFETKDRNMKYLTELENKIKLGKDLSKDDLIFLYEFNNQIEGFGYNKDPRIKEIKSARDEKNDFVVIFDHKFSRDEISTTREEALSGKFKVHFGTFYLRDSDFPTDVGFELPKVFYGDLIVTNSVRSFQGSKFPETLNGNLNLDGFKSTEGLILPETINGRLFVAGLKTVQGLKRPKGLINYKGPTDWSHE